MMLIKQGAGLGLLNSIKNGFATFLLLLVIGFACHWNSLYGVTYYLYIADLAASFIEIPTSNVSGQSPTIASKYLAGESPIYSVNNKKVGTYMASFLSMQTASGIHTIISNYLSADKTALIKNRRIVNWFLPTKPINLELDSIINSMVTQYMIETTTMVGLAPSLGKTFDLAISSDSEKIYFKFSKK